MYGKPEKRDGSFFSLFMKKVTHSIETFTKTSKLVTM